PFAVDDGEPRRVAVLALDDHVLAKQTLEREAEADCGRFRRLVAVVALPLEAAIAELVEHVARSEEECLGRNPGPRDRRTPQDVADLDHAMRGLHAHQRLAARGLAGRAIY